VGLQGGEARGTDGGAFDSASLRDALVNMTTFISTLHQQQEAQQRTEWYSICDTDTDDGLGPEEDERASVEGVPTPLRRGAPRAPERRAKDGPAKLPTPARVGVELGRSAGAFRCRARESAAKKAREPSERDELHHKWVSFLFDEGGSRAIR